MFDIGWSEMAVIALVALLVIGPKDLPNTMKTVAQWVRKARALTREFQSSLEEMVREAELDDAKKMLEETRSGNLARTIGNAIDPDGSLSGEIRDVEQTAQHSDGGADTAAATATTAEPASNAERAAATIATEPANVAPAHSLTPPSEGGASEDASAASSGEAASGDKDTKQSA